MLAIEGMFLDTVIELQGVVQRLSITRCTGIFRQTIDSKADGVELFLGIERLAL